MQEEYTGTLLEDGHISIPQEIIDKLNPVVAKELGYETRKAMSTKLTMMYMR